MNIIHIRAVKNYKKELISFIEICSKLDVTLLADMLIMSIWTRAGMQNEGLFRLPGGEINMSSKLIAYPYMLDDFKKIIKEFKRKGLDTEATAMSIWTHTLKCLINYSDMINEYNDLWSLLIKTKSYWDIKLQKYYNADRKRLDPQMLEKTFALSNQILAETPPVDIKGSEILGESYLIEEDRKQSEINPSNRSMNGTHKYCGKEDSPKYIWVTDEKNGPGAYYNNEGATYIGVIQNGKRHGYGIFQDAVGNFYEGEYVNDKPEGQGTYIWSNGKKYIGEWMDGKREGFGKLYYPNGESYVGEFKKGLKNGNGRQIYQNGSEYKGEWENGLRHGVGEFSYPNGLRVNSNWKNDYSDSKDPFFEKDGSLPEKVGGWLGLLVASLVFLSPLFSLTLLVLNWFEYNLTIFNYPDIATIVLIETLAAVGFIVFGIIAGVRLIKIHPRAVITTKWFLLLLVIYQLVINIVVFSIFPESGFGSQGFIQQLIYSVIWYIYLCNSKRVWTTYNFIPNQIKRFKEKQL